MANIFSPEAPQLGDAELVARCQAGDAAAFAQIVARYQSLVCALTYSATGNVHQSEDLAQETFLAAWKNLANLREPAKLRPWLCGIARNRSLNRLRGNRREPTHAAEALADFDQAKENEPGPDTLAMSRDEETLVWRALEEVPETYREPMVLFYRQDQSVENVARALELSEEAVRQRLSRGRKLLSEKVEKLVEGTLAKTNPGRAFTTGVMSALPMMAGSAKSTAVASALAKGGTAFKAMALTSWAAAILGPLAGVLGGWLGFKVSVESSNSPRERSFKIKNGRRALKLVAVTVVGQLLLVFVVDPLLSGQPTAVAVITVGFWLIYAVVLAGMIFQSNAGLQTILREEGTLATSLGVTTAYEYRSRWKLLGWPLVHINSGITPEGRIRTAKGWIAIGDMAVGGVALGGLSLGVVSAGGVSAGVFSTGGLVVGLAVLAGLAIGGWAIGGMAIGYYAYGGMAYGWRAALGGEAIGHDMAVGGSAIAPHANDAVARAFIEASPYFPSVHTVLLVAPFLVWAPMLLVVWQAIRIYRGKKSVARLKLAELFGQQLK